ncbi:MAG: tRNA (N6-isopentenyl adenosine(37)-C2)-methylthiotransferase MiaB [Clostridium sp.]
MKNNIKKTNKNVDPKTFFIHTYGCQMNAEDSEKLSGMLKLKDYTRVYDETISDIIVFNTCCVRENAEQKVFGHIGALKKLKSEKPELVIAICGCMMQQEGMKEEIIKRFPYVDIIIGTHNSYKFPEYLNRALGGERPILEIWDKEQDIVEDLPIDRVSEFKAYVTIMYGCNNFCTYCIVPHVRGRERSRKPEDIENEIKELVSKGYTEITLLGQNVNSYGLGLEPELNFSNLLRRINKIPGVERIRFMTSHPKDLSEDLISAMVECDKVCEHFHLPVQSGSSSILKKMNRHYDREHYLNVVKKLRDAIPNIAITTDIIIGFPGETNEDFEETLSLAKEVGFDLAYTFLYSKRNGTPAAKFLIQVSEEEKHERFNKLVEELNNIAAMKNMEYKGKAVEVLVEGLSKNDPSKLTGRTRTGKLVNFTGNHSNIGKLVMVKITEARSFSLLGEELQ